MARARSASLHAGVTRGSNVHLIVLESFLDPTLFRNVVFSTSPVHPEFAGLFAGNEGTVRSAVFGGRTCQAEFEALCGLPPFAHVSATADRRSHTHPKRDKRDYFAAYTGLIAEAVR